ncbi:MAG: hypothetical protein JW764_09125 [Chlorobiaceae bacterium]|nr:hypothetical protein [Chlorobiaceae bacterium]
MFSLKLISLVIDPVMAIKYRKLLRRFRRTVGYVPKISLPERYHEKMLWRKIFDRNPEFRVFCNKLATKEYIRLKCPSLKIPATLWQTDCVDEIDKLPVSEGMVIKASHGCGFNYFPTSAPGERQELKRLATEWLEQEYGGKSYEWGYFGIERKIFAEKLITRSSAGELLDLGIRCSNGKPILLSATLNAKKPGERLGYFDLEGKRVYTIENSRGDANALDDDFELPPAFREAIRYAEVLSRGVDYARFDFMISRSEVYAGEITVYPATGMTLASKENQIGADIICNGDWDLRYSWFLKSRQSGWKALYAKLFMSYLNRQAEVAG